MTDRPPLVLAIDTSGPRLQLALARGDVVDTHVEELPKGHAELLFGRIGDLLAGDRAGYADLTRLAVTTGPGSFTGLRIGIAAARGLALALDIPVIGIGNLLAISLAHPGPTDVLLDARRDQSYAQSFASAGVPETEAVLLDSRDAAARFPRPGISLVTDPQVHIAPLARFSLTADPALHPPVPQYVRAADAKAQAPVLTFAPPLP